VTSIQVIVVSSGFRVFVPALKLYCCVFAAAILFLLRIIIIPFCIILLYLCCICVFVLALYLELQLESLHVSKYLLD
jgi:hypothetical protein